MNSESRFDSLVSEPRSIHPFFVVCFMGIGLLASWASAKTVLTSEGAEIAFELLGVAEAQLRVEDRENTLLDLGGLPLGGESGDPLLPYSKVRVLLPANADLESVRVALVRGDWQELPDRYDLAPAPPAVTWDEHKPLIDWGGKDPARIIAGRDMAIYGQDAFFPEQTIRIESVGQYRNWKLAEVIIQRAVYNPVQKRLRILKQTGVNVTTSVMGNGIDRQAAGRAGLIDRGGRGKFARELLSACVNAEDAATEAAPVKDPDAPVSDYVIITTNEIRNTSTALAEFITCRQACGNAVRVVTEAETADDTHYASGTTTDERALNIRSWLQSRWSAGGIEYVLLIGNPHPTEFTPATSVPMKMCHPQTIWPTYPDTPSDMFYAELSGNWDKDGDNIFGEYYGDFGSGGADRYCELHVGRIPFYGKYADLDSILRKIVLYCGEPGDRAWR
ncbi:MAG: hypothetical protein JW810_07085, partial [Sedimentisphaerales bacterium]|nr:hypothetical protein [Sedimentisphaerales bacterium]